MDKKEMNERLDKIRGSLPAQEAMLLAMDRARSLADCEAWCRDHPGEPLLGDPREVLYPLRKTPSRPPLDELIKKVRRNLVDRLFLIRLWWDCNRYAANITERKLPWLAVIAEKNWREVEQLESRRVALVEGLQILGAEPYPLNLDDAVALEAAINHQVYPWEPFLSCDVPDSAQEDPATDAGNGAAGALEQAIRSLIAAGDVKAGTAVELTPMPIESLLLAPLVEGQWIDRHVVELAEFGAVVEEGGFELQVTEDRFMAPLQVGRREGGQFIEAEETLIAAVRAQTTAALAEFTGRATEIEGRSYLHIDDYRAWSARRTQGDLQPVEGLVVESWNRWVDHQGGEGQAQLAGRKVRKLSTMAERADFTICAYPDQPRMLREQRALRQVKIRHLLDECQAPQVSYGDNLRDLLNELWETRFAIKDIGDRYFKGREVLFREYHDRLMELIDLAEGSANSYNRLLDVIHPFGMSPSGSDPLPSRVDVSHIKAVAKNSSKALADALVGKVHLASRIGIAASKRAHEILTSIILEMR